MKPSAAGVPSQQGAGTSSWDWSLCRTSEEALGDGQASCAGECTPVSPENEAEASEQERHLEKV